MSRGIGYSLEGLVLREETKKGRTGRGGILFFHFLYWHGVAIVSLCPEWEVFDATYG